MSNFTSDNNTVWSLPVVVDFAVQTVAPILNGTTSNDSTATVENMTDTVGATDASAAEDGEEEVTVTTWSLIYVTALVSLVQGLVFYAFFLHQRKKEAAKESYDLYEPRQHTRKHRSPEPYSPTTTAVKSWWRAALDVDQDELLRCVGLDSYMFLRFLRLSARLCGVGTCLALVLIPVFATGDGTGNHTLQFNQLTLARVEAGSNRLWAAVIAWFIFVGFTLWSFHEEWKLYSKNRYSFLARGDVDMQREYRYAVRVEQIPSKYRSDQALYDYFDRLFPGQVQQATVFVETPELNKLIQERQHNIELLEKAVAFVYAKPEKPRPLIKVKKDDDGACGGQKIDAIEHHEAEIARLNVAVDQERASFLRALPVVSKQSVTTACSKNADTSSGGDAIGSSDGADGKEIPFKGSGKGVELALYPDPSAGAEKMESVDLDEKEYGRDANDAELKDIVVKYTSSAHVTFTSLRSKQAAIQCELTGNPDSMVVVAAPDPKAVLWNNVGVPLPQQKVFQIQAAVLFTVGILFWAFPVAFVTAIANLNGILKGLGLPQADPNQAWYGLISGLLPVIFLAILMAVLYMTIVAAATFFVRYKSAAEVDAYSLYWHQLFQFANLWLILIGGSAFDQIDELIDDPASIFDVIAEAMPKQAVFFTNMMLVGSFGAMGMELSLLPAYGVSMIMKLIQPEAMLTQRQLDQAKTPPSIVWGKQVPPAVFIFLVIVVYMPIVPLMEVFGLIYFSGYYLVYKHQCLHVYAQEFEGGGEATWQSLFPFLIACLYMGEFVFIAYMGIKEAPIQGGLGFIPLILTILFHLHLNRTTVQPLGNLSLEVAAEVDIDDGELDHTNTLVLYATPALKTEEEERAPLPYRRASSDAEGGVERTKEPVFTPPADETDPEELRTGTF